MLDFTFILSTKEYLSAKQTALKYYKNIKMDFFNFATDLADIDFNDLKTVNREDFNKMLEDYGGVEEVKNAFLGSLFVLGYLYESKTKRRANYGLIKNIFQ